MIELLTLPADEAERLAYAEGFTGTATLFARIVDLEHQRDLQDADIADLMDRVKYLEDQIEQMQRSIEQLEASVYE